MFCFIFSGKTVKSLNEVAMTKLSLAKEESGNFDFKYSLLDDHQEKTANKFLVHLSLATEDPQQVKIVVTSAKLNGTNYPSNSRNRFVLF